LKIEDGRWIQMDEGNVLCERCWKNMYLPKVRATEHCSLLIPFSDMTWVPFQVSSV
jgi:hypothetical protein